MQYPKYNREIQIYEDFLIKEPHAIYNFGKLLQLLKPHLLKLYKVNALCVGADFIKEYLLAKFLMAKVDCVDIDKYKINLYKIISKKFNLKINYYHADIFKYDIKNYNCLLLYQMDYIFSDSQINLILKKFKNHSKKYIIVMTPSISNLTLKNNILVLIYNFISYLYFISKYFFINYKFIRNKNFQHYYQRTSFGIVNLFKKNKFLLLEKKYYLIQNSNYSLYLFRN